MRPFFPALILSIILFSCNEEHVLVFSDKSETYNDNANIEINFPYAEGKSARAKTINYIIENHIANMLTFSEEPEDSLDLSQAVTEFDNEYKRFKEDIAESALVWEAIFDAEVIYQSQEVITLAINGYLNTGGAHGNMNITLYNFDESGKVLEVDDIIKDHDAFTNFVKPYFETAIREKDNDEQISDYFFGDPFHLPANIGINEDGVLMLYNVYEIGSYAQGLTEFTIPFEDVEKFLRFH
ncbi:MAG: DUF3298 and DUF4163 domain-containing protein [Bacteroidia bacterium]|nr:DUF3298 and DUF4163 domain-containing protein [Bacteroidia bacterium]